MDDSVVINATTQPGKAMDATSFSRGGQDLFRERVVLGDDSGAIIGSFPTTAPAADAPGLPVRQVGSLPPTTFGAITFANVAVSSAGQQLPNHAGSVVRVRAPVANSGNVWLWMDDTATVGKGWELGPGDVLELPISNANLLYAAPDNGSQSLELIVM